jgi:NAD(P)-dependent dehydrogenase (short-subunit alcohol dehydrogenase family)
MSKRVGNGEGPSPPSLVVTGASSGIGHAVAKLAIAQGWRVFGSVRSEADAERLTGGVRRFFRAVFVRRAGPCGHRSCREGGSPGSRTLGGLVNNAGNQPLDEFRAVLEAFDKGVRAIIDAGRRHSLEASDVADTVMKALTARRPRLRYAPAQHALLEQALPRAAPKRVTDFVIEQALGLKPDTESLLKGISA